MRVIVDFTRSVEHYCYAVMVDFIEILFGWQHNVEYLFCFDFLGTRVNSRTNVLFSMRVEYLDFVSSSPDLIREYNI